jgi:hypothetical protein
MMEKCENASSVTPKGYIEQEFIHDAELHDWTLLPFFNGGLIISGRIYNDKKNRFADGTRVRTSKLISVYNGKATTQNTKYLLVNK